MHLLLKGFIFTLLLMKTQQISIPHRTGSRLLDFRKMMKVFVRYNVKVDVVPYTSIFAFAMGFRGNWDIIPAKILNSMKRISQKEDMVGQESSQSDSQNQYQDVNYQSAQYQRAIHSAVQRGFDLHGLNGTACLQRTLCEVSLINQEDVISRVFKTFFNSTEEFSCSADLPCPFSLVDFIDHILTGNIDVQSYM